MPLPERVQVKLSSEAAEYVALTPVVVRELPLIELLEHAVSAAGPDAARVRDILKRGSLVSGASRFRWAGWECDAAELEAALRALPGPEPSRVFVGEQCVKVVLSGPGTRIEIAREAAAQKRLFSRSSFWQHLLHGAAAPAYGGYLYKDRADRYVAELSEEQRDALKEAAGLLRYDALARQIRAARLERVEFVVARAAG